MYQMTEEEQDVAFEFGDMNPYDYLDIVRARGDMTAVARVANYIEGIKDTGAVE